MTWEEMLAAMQALGCRKDLLSMLEPGNWRCSLPAPICGNGLVVSDFGGGEHPGEAVAEAWRKIEAVKEPQYLSVRHPGLPERRYRWAGFMWLELPAAPPGAGR